MVESTRLGEACGPLRQRWLAAHAAFEAIGVDSSSCSHPPFISSRVRVAHHRGFHILAVAHPLPCEKREKVLKLHDFAACIRFGIARGQLMHAWSNLSLIDLNVVNLAEVNLNLVPSALYY